MHVPLPREPIRSEQAELDPLDEAPVLLGELQVGSGRFDDDVDEAAAVDPATRYAWTRSGRPEVGRLLVSAAATAGPVPGGAGGGASGDET